MTKSQLIIVEKANKFCEENNITNYPVNIITLCAKYGLQVFEKYLPQNVSGFIVFQAENFLDFNTGKVIVVNLLHGPARRRFTIAHELAHFVLHKSENETIYAHRDAGQNGGIEQEANIFASNILMPENLVKNALSKLDSSFWGSALDSEKIRYISEEFAVSRAAAQVRLEQLQMI